MDIIKKLNIGDTFIIQKESNEHECYIGQKVIIQHIDGVDDYASCYLVQDDRDNDFFCTLQSVPFEEIEN